jgi:hypothetical protein
MCFLVVILFDTQLRYLSLPLFPSLDRWWQLPLKEVRAVTHHSITHKMQMELQVQKVCLQKQNVGCLLSVIEFMD